MFHTGRETVVVVDGKPWTVGRLTYDKLESFTDWVKEQVGDPFKDLERFIDKVDKATANEMLREACAKRDALQSMDLQSPLFQTHLKTARGLVRLLWLLLLEHHPSATPADAFAVVSAEGQRVKAALEAAAGNAGPAGPNGVAPAAQPGG